MELTGGTYYSRGGGQKRSPRGNRVSQVVERTNGKGSLSTKTEPRTDNRSTKVESSVEGMGKENGPSTRGKKKKKTEEVEKKLVQWKEVFVPITTLKSWGKRSSVHQNKENYADPSLGGRKRVRFSKS